MNANLAQGYFRVSEYKEPNRKWNPILRLTIIHHTIQVYNARYFKEVTHLGTEQFLRCLTSLSVMEPVFQRDVAISRLARQVARKYSSKY